MPDMVFARVNAPHVTPVGGQGKVHLRFVPDKGWLNQDSLKPDCTFRSKATYEITDRPLDCLRCMEAFQRYQWQAEYYLPANVLDVARRGLDELMALVVMNSGDMQVYARLANGTPEVGGEVVDAAERLRLLVLALTALKDKLRSEPRPNPGDDPRGT